MLTHLETHIQAPDFLCSQGNCLVKFQGAGGSEEREFLILRAEMSGKWKVPLAPGSTSAAAHI